MKSRRPKDPSATDERDLSADVAPGTAGRPRVSEPFEDILARRLRARRSFLKALAGVSAAAPLFSVMPSLIYYRKAAAAGDFPESLTFQPIAGSSADEVLVPRGYKAQVLLRWGDSLHDDVPDLDPDDLKILLTDEGVRRQKKQFGYNCDLNAYFSLPRPNCCS